MDQGRPTPRTPRRLVGARTAVTVGLCLVGSLFLPAEGLAQRPGVSSAPPRVGLVLSGGSSKGLAHIGVLRVLEAAGIRPAVVTGTSMGGIVGGLYATGVSVDSLTTLAERLEWDALLSDRPERKLITPERRALGTRLLIELPFEDRHVRIPSGVMEGAAIYRTLSDLVWPWAGVRDFRRLPIPFAAVATDLATGEGVRLEEGVLADAIRATMAVPGVIDPMVMDGRTLVDGGLARNLPAEDALALGADVLICSDVSDPLKDPERLQSLLDVLVQAVTFRMTESVEEQRALCDVLIRPDIEGLSYTDFTRSEEWITRGESAAREALAEWQPKDGALSTPQDPNASRGDRPPAAPMADSVYVHALRLVGLDDADARRFVLRTVGLPTPGWITRGRLDAVLADLSASQLYRSLRYRLDVTDTETTLVLRLRPRTADRVGVGLRYDDHYGAALLFNGTFYNWLGYGSLTHLDVRLGDELQIQGRLLRGRGLTSRLNVGATAGWSRAPFDIREGGRTIARGEVDWFTLRGLIAPAVGRLGFVGLDLGGEWASGETVIAPFDSTGTVSLISGAVLAFGETLDDPDFPMAGVRLYARGEMGASTLDDGASFHHEVADVLVAHPLTPDVSLLLGAFAGRSGGAGLPLHRRFYLGGVQTSSVFSETQRPFLGMVPQELRGGAAQVLRARVRWRIRRNRYVTLALDAGGAQGTWGFDTDSYTVGWGVEAAAASILGPLSLTLHGRSLHDAMLSLSVGRVF